MPDISKITLPSGSTYDIKDEVARQMISGGVSFNITWDGTTTPDPASIPAGVEVIYQGVTYTGTLAADDPSVQAGAFYLVKSTTSVGVTDVYDEYVPVGPAGSKTWEKIGDTQIDLSDVVTDVTLNKQTTNFVTGYASPTTDSVIGADATFSVTQPTITVTPSQTYLGASASGANTAWNSKDQKTVITGLGTASSDSVIGADATFSFTQPTISVTPSTTYLGATASGTAVSASGDSVTVVTGYESPTTDTFVKSVSAETNKNLVTTTVTGVNGSTVASKATAGTSQTTADGTGTASSTNTDWLKGVSVTNETLIIGAATMDTQTTTQYTFADVTVPVAASSATTVATGATSTTGTGDAVVTGVTIGSSASAITGLGTASTDTVIGTASTFTVTQPTISLGTNASTATGRVQVATGISSATATGGAVDWDSKDTVTAVTGYSSPSTANVIGSSATFTITQPTIALASNDATATGRVQVATGIASANATGTAVDWDSKDSVSAITGLGTATTSAGLNDTTTITVTKGN